MGERVFSARIQGGLVGPGVQGGRAASARAPGDNVWPRINGGVVSAGVQGFLWHEERVIRMLMDKEFMRHQRDEVMGNHENVVNRRIKERELWELEREKRLILEGKMGIDEAPYIADHPVFVVSKMTNLILEEKKLKVAEKLKTKLSRSLDYEQPKGGGGSEEESEEESIVPLDGEELEKARIIWEMERKIEEGEIFSQEEYERIKYENPLVKKLRTLESVSEMYDLAEEILGPVVFHVQRNKSKG